MISLSSICRIILINPSKKCVCQSNQSGASYLRNLIEDFRKLKSLDTSLTWQADIEILPIVIVNLSFQFTCMTIVDCH